MITYNYLQLFSTLLIFFVGGALFGSLAMWTYLDQLKGGK